MKEGYIIEGNASPEVTIIIPVYNEEKFIGKTLKSLINNDFPKDKLEILIFDGGSNDNTLNILEEYAKKYSFIKILKNPKKLQVYALNEGIKLAKGNIIIRCDAHAEYPKNYIKEIVNTLKTRKEVWNVGGIWYTYPANSRSLIATAIAIVLNSKLGVGKSYRTYRENKSTYVDTVPFGAWRKRDIIEKIGLFDESFWGDEDYEYNLRIRKKGGKLLLIPSLKIRYYARSTFKDLLLMAFRYGYSKILTIKKHKTIGNLRQLIPPFFVILLPITIYPYIGLYLPYSVYLALKNKNIKLAIPIFIAFFSLHIGYGFGFIYGLIREILSNWFYKIKI